MSRRVRRRRDGSFAFRLPIEERDVLRTVGRQLRELLTSGSPEAPSAADDPALQRLFPPAYGAGDASRSAEYAAMVHDDLVRHRLASLDALEAAASAESLDEEQVVACIGALNDLRLVLGTRLDVGEARDWAESVGPDDPNFGGYILYDYLTFLQGTLLEALTGDEVL